MPYLNLKLSSATSPETAGEVAATLSALTADMLGKKPEVTSVSVEFVDPEYWFVGGRSISEQSAATFYLDLKITEGTNTKAQKAHYIARVFEGMQSLLGPLATASYIVIHDVRADAWGFEGRTQEYRFVSNALI